MSLQRRSARSNSNYDECIVHLLSAFFCLTGRTSADETLRKAIEEALVDLSRVQAGPVRPKKPAPSNVIPLSWSRCRPR